MNLRLYMDHRVPAAVVEGLRRRGVGVLAAAEDDCADCDDEQLQRRAHELKRFIYSQDGDFLEIGHGWSLAGRAFSGIIYAHQLRITVGQAIHDLELIYSVMTQEEFLNRIEFIPLK